MQRKRARKLLDLASPEGEDNPYNALVAEKTLADTGHDRRLAGRSKATLAEGMSSA